jgi:hypothetical protein
MVYTATSVVVLVAGDFPVSLIVLPGLGATVMFILALPIRKADNAPMAWTRRVAWGVMAAGLLPLVSFAFILGPLLLTCLPSLWARDYPGAERRPSIG